ncbi:uncharacterized protein LOC106175459 [Lingula anatina]|uniref:Uncharacterized protein LOC106175459 n=1 Tax=Lingula anatina TaxID=7574 RepID=A0A1S3JRH1_LINAN|nr:uncharacterized protein LOC106175459 [Lingula anatina]|eukprot:XP_013412937.1 uncharacterized protein LOC106175459 [Lingula anatina]
MNLAYLQRDAQMLLHGRHVVIIGSSVMRCVYKDLVLLLQANRYLTTAQLKAKGEKTFLGDELLMGGCLGEMVNSTKYREVRRYHGHNVMVTYYFIVRCYDDYVQQVLEDLEQMKPDVIIMSSCIWDMTSYGSNAIPAYRTNIRRLFDHLNLVLSPSSLFMWMSTLPVNKKPRGGFLEPSKAFNPYNPCNLHLDITAGNHCARLEALFHGYSVLDMCELFTQHVHLRAPDGVHWNEIAHRRITNIYLTKLSQRWHFMAPSHRILGLQPSQLRHCRSYTTDSLADRYIGYGTLYAPGLDLDNNISVPRFSFQKPLSVERSKVPSTSGKQVSNEASCKVSNNNKSDANGNAMKSSNETTEEESVSATKEVVQQSENAKMSQECENAAKATEVRKDTAESTSEGESDVKITEEIIDLTNISQDSESAITTIQESENISQTSQENDLVMKAVHEDDIPSRELQESSVIASSIPNSTSGSESKEASNADTEPETGASGSKSKEEMGMNGQVSDSDIVIVETRCKPQMSADVHESEVPVDDMAKTPTEEASQLTVIKVKSAEKEVCSSENTVDVKPMSQVQQDNTKQSRKIPLKILDGNNIETVKPSTGTALKRKLFVKKSYNVAAVKKRKTVHVNPKHRHFNSGRMQWQMDCQQVNGEFHHGPFTQHSYEERQWSGPPQDPDYMASCPQQQWNGQQGGYDKHLPPNWNQQGGYNGHCPPQDWSWQEVSCSAPNQGWNQEGYGRNVPSQGWNQEQGYKEEWNPHCGNFPSHNLNRQGGCNENFNYQEWRQQGYHCNINPPQENQGMHNYGRDIHNPAAQSGTWNQGPYCNPVPLEGDQNSGYGGDLHARSDPVRGGCTGPFWQQESGWQNNGNYQLYPETGACVNRGLQFQPPSGFAEDSLKDVAAENECAWTREPKMMFDLRTLLNRRRSRTNLV